MQHLNLGGLDQFTGYVVRRAQVWIFQDFKRVLRKFDITPAQFSVVKIVAANPGVVQARVAEVLAIERARLVEMLDRLERRGLIVRSRSPSDRRSHALHLTQGAPACWSACRHRSPRTSSTCWTASAPTTSASCCASCGRCCARPVRALCA